MNNMTLEEKKKRFEMPYTGASMLKLDNLGKELIRIWNEKYWEMSENDFSKRIGVTVETLRSLTIKERNTSQVKSIIKREFTQRKTIATIAKNLDMDFKIVSQKEGNFIYFYEKEEQITNQVNENLKVAESISDYNITPGDVENFVEIVVNYLNSLNNEYERINFFRILLNRVYKDSSLGSTAKGETEETPESKENQ